MIKIIKRFFASRAWRHAFLGGVIGAVLFVAIYGVGSIIPTNVYWVYHAPDTDLPTHQLGFDFYRANIGMYVPQIYTGYPEGQISSVVYSDSIPIVSLFFKLLTPFLPDFFQFWGIWVLFCFIMQGTLAALIMRKCNLELLPTALVTPVFICNTNMLFRVFHHSSLAAQWLLLSVVLVWLYRDKINTTKRRAVVWSFLTALSVSIHFYFLVMIGIMMVVYMIYDCIITKSVLSNAVAFLSAVVCTGAVWYLAGGMVASSSESGDIGLGAFSLNLLSMFNSMGRSLYIPGFGYYKGQILEDTAYLGLGGFVLLLVSLYAFFRKRKSIVAFCKKNKIELLAVISVMFLLTLAALSPIITFGDKEILNYTVLLPKPVISLWSIIRSTARFFWLVWYTVLIAMIILISKSINKRYLIFVFAVASLVQYMDVVPGAARLYDRMFERSAGYHSEFYDTLSEVLSTNAKHIAMITEPYNGYIEPALYGSKHDMTINVAYLARVGGWNVSKALSEWNSGQLRDDTVYCIPIMCTYMLDERDIPKDFTCLEFGGYCVILNDGLLIGESDTARAIDSKGLRNIIKNVKALNTEHIENNKG